MKRASWRLRCFKVPFIYSSPRLTPWAFLLAAVYQGATMNLDEIWQHGYQSAITGSRTISDCPFRDFKLKRAWVLGFIEGLRTRWASDR